MAEYEVTHTTRYTYSEKVSHCHNVGYLAPQSDAHQDCRDSGISVSPYPTILRQHNDYFGNKFYYFSVEEPHDRLEVVGKTRVVTRPSTFDAWETSPPWETVVAALRNPAGEAEIRAQEFTLPSPFVPGSQHFTAFAAEVFAPGKPVLQGALDFARRIFQEFKYEQKATTILTPLTEVFEKRKGVCQDFAHLSIAALRSLGLAAQYVSGYIETFPPQGKAKLRGSDASHAWFSVYVPGTGPGTGWFDFDPTNGKAITEEFIVTARGRDFGDVSPLKGILFGGGKHVLKVEVDVHRVA
ncbi:MAG: transglutaminase family protein [Spirochaetes bacterium]|nr:transglutaminase family protein [Spirochaetota bacterium]